MPFLTDDLILGKKQITTKMAYKMMVGVHLNMPSYFLRIFTKYPI